MKKMVQTYRFDLDSLICQVSSGAWNVRYAIKNQLPLIHSLWSQACAQVRSFTLDLTVAPKGLLAPTTKRTFSGCKCHFCTTDLAGARPTSVMSTELERTCFGLDWSDRSASNWLEKIFISHTCQSISLKLHVRQSVSLAAVFFVHWGGFANGILSVVSLFVPNVI